MFTLMRGLGRRAAVAVGIGALSLALSSCADDAGFTSVSGIDFLVEPAGMDPVESDTPSPSPGGGCALVGAGRCVPDGVTCCDPEVSRCVPAGEGVNRCVPSGETAPGARCGEGDVDSCGFGYLCAASRSDAWLRCRRLCESTAVDCSEGERCEVSFVVSQVLVGVCTPQTE